MNAGDIIIKAGCDITIHKGEGPRMVCKTMNNGSIEVYMESRFTDSTTINVGEGFNANLLGVRYPHGVNSYGLVESGFAMRDAFQAITEHQKIRAAFGK